MDDIVKQAMRKWPDVPNCFGWLALDRRGQWRMRDDAAQQAGAPGDPIRHDGLVQFIARNYQCDADGRWFFQNGPQRVFVELDYTPWVARFHAGRFTVMTGDPLQVDTCLLDEQGNLLLAGTLPERLASTAAQSSPHSHIALLSDTELQAVEALIAWRDDYDEQDPDASPGDLVMPDGNRLPIARIRADHVAARFGFIANPQRHAQAGA